MLIDCFLFLNEYDILESRLHYLDNVVDYFILVESNISFSGKQKPLHFLENQLRFSRFKHKIIYYPFIFDNSIYNFNFENYQAYESDQWKLEKLQRNHISNALNLFKENPFVMLSDVDEIPNLLAIEFIQNNLNLNNPVASLITEMYFYNLNNREVTNFPNIIFTTKDFLVEKTPELLRSNRRINMPFVYNGGWHLSYFGSTVDIKYKIQSYSHRENDRDDVIDENNIIDSINNGKCLITHDQRFLKTNKEDFPPDFWTFFGKFHPNYN